MRFERREWEVGTIIALAIAVAVSNKKPECYSKLVIYFQFEILIK
jgi:hypothetical protein